MPSYEWDVALETGNEQVDSQHKYLFGLLNELLAAHASDESGPAVSLVLDRLLMYAATHFADEEALMEASGFAEPSAHRHRESHRDLTQQTREFVLDYRLGKVTSVVPVTEFLCEWLGNHIEREDRLLVEHLRADECA